MATRATGWALLSSASVQEAMDFALIARASTLAARVPEDLRRLLALARADAEQRYRYYEQLANAGGPHREHA
jgi:hypothetical protein